MADWPLAAKAASPGGLLRQQRKKLDMSAEEVAGRLHLDPGIITALEEDDYEQIASPAYARGYLASYARLVNADSGRIMALFDKIMPAELPEISSEVKPPIQVSSSHKAIRVLTYLIGLGLAVLFLIWYRGHFSAGTVPVDDTIMDEERPALVAPVPIPVPVPEPDRVPAPDMASVVAEAGEPRAPRFEQPQPEARRAEEPQPEEQQAGEPQTPALIPAPFEASLAGQVVDQAPPVPDVDVAAWPDRSLAEAGQTGQARPLLEDDAGDPPPGATPLENTENNEAETLITPAAFDSLRLTFSNDSWVEVYDADENRLFRDLAMSGEEHLIEGAAPFRILFGFSPGVAVEFNGKKVEHAGYSRNGIARFTLPDADRL